MWTDGYIQVPQHTKDAIDRYIHDGLKPGDFVLSVLRNDLVGAAQRADWVNIKYLRDIVIYCCTYVPSNYWRSADNVDRYLRSRSPEYEHGIDRLDIRKEEVRKLLDEVKDVVSDVQEVLPFTRSY